MELRIPEGEDLINGSKCLEYGVPWMVPGAILKLDEILTKEDTVFEVGCGGSTLFFTKRCAAVFGIESNPEWLKTVEAKVVELEHKKEVSLIQRSSESEMCQFFSNCVWLNPYITFISIDPEGNFNRSNILQSYLINRSNNQLKGIILDNYAHEGLFPDHYNKDWTQEGWDVFDYNHDRWSGSGTRILVKKQ